MDRICERAAAAVAALPNDDAPVLVIGSSLGGYTAALLAAAGRIPRASALLLIAPAFGFGERWAERLGIAGVAEWRRTGQRAFFHFASEREQPLGVGFMESAERLPGFPLAPEIPVVIVHGRRDDTVDWQQSRRYADQDANIEFHLVDGDHRLTDQRHEDLIAWCARDLIQRIA
jgi:alpha-beta hydrolase superfamily lysophospholipase